MLEELMLSFQSFYPLLQDFMYNNQDGMSQQMGDESLKSYLSHLGKHLQKCLNMTQKPFMKMKEGNLQCFSAKAKIALLIESRHHFDSKVLAEKICMKASHGH
jgi:hypothetical protein